MAIQLLVADDHEVIRKGLASLLQDEGIEIVAEAKNGKEAVEQTAKHNPDVLLMDVMMPEVSGLEALEEIREKTPKTRIVMMSAHDNPTYIARAAALGATEFVMKDSGREKIVSAIQCAAEGRDAPSDSLLHRVRDNLSRRLDPAADDVPLTKREYQVLRHLAYGLSNREIGRSLKISIETVKEHVQNILRKLNANDRTEAAVWAVRRGLV